MSRIKSSVIFKILDDVSRFKRMYVRHGEGLAKLAGTQRQGEMDQ